MALRAPVQAGLLNLSCPPAPRPEYHREDLLPPPGSAQAKFYFYNCLLWIYGVTELCDFSGLEQSLEDIHAPSKCADKEAEVKSGRVTLLKAPVYG